MDKYRKVDTNKQNIKEFLSLVVDDLNDDLVEQSSYSTGVMTAWRVYSLKGFTKYEPKTIGALEQALTSLGIFHI